MKSIAVALAIAVFSTVAGDAQPSSRDLAYVASRQIDPDAHEYLYAPSIMFDEVESKFKVWGCGALGGASSGDHIIMKEAETLGALDGAEWHVAFQPQRLPGTDQAQHFDTLHTCDPNVLRDPQDPTTTYLYYGGNVESGSQVVGSSLGRTTRIGIAVDTENGGRDFARVDDGNFLLEVGTVPLDDGEVYVDGYGVGQPAVAYRHGEYYMVFTEHIFVLNDDRTIADLPANFAFWDGSRPLEVEPADPHEGIDYYTQAELDRRDEWVQRKVRLHVIKSQSPTFENYSVVRAAIPGSEVGGVSVDILSDEASDGFVVVANNLDRKIKLTYYTPSFTAPTDQTVLRSGAEAGQFREGIGLLTDSQKRLSDRFPNSLIFVGPVVTFAGRMRSQIFARDTADLGMFRGNPASGATAGSWWKAGARDGTFVNKDPVQWAGAPSDWGKQTFSGLFNDDAIWDIGFYDGAGTVEVHYGDGQGSFTPGFTTKLREVGPQGPMVSGGQVFAGDFNADGRWDIAVYGSANQPGHLALHYRHTTAAGFAEGYLWQWHEATISGIKFAAGDFDGDGDWDDFAYRSDANEYVRVRYGSDDAADKFATQIQSTWDWCATEGLFRPAEQLVGGDFNGDGLADLGLYNPYQGGDVHIRYQTTTATGRGTGHFQSCADGRVVHWEEGGVVYAGDFFSDES